MTPAPELRSGKLECWRLERAIYVAGWQRAEGSYLYGGRWSSAGRRVLYASHDPSTAILEVAVHKGFRVLNSVAHDLLRMEVAVPALRIVTRAEIPNPLWLVPTAVSPAQQQFGDALLREHGAVVLPSVVSGHCWNVLIDADVLASALRLVSQERFGLDPRLDRPGA